MVSLEELLENEALMNEEAFQKTDGRNLCTNKTL